MQHGLKALILEKEMLPRYKCCSGILFGEATGFLHMNGAGIDTAIDSGYLVGEAISEVLKNGGDAWQLYYDKTKDIRNHIRECAKHQQMFR